ncbi:MAG: hypothetical protein ACI9BW_004734, partial [Gammaproteobacteria bacterium]
MIHESIHNRQITMNLLKTIGAVVSLSFVALSFDAFA